MHVVGWTCVVYEQFEFGGSDVIVLFSSPEPKAQVSYCHSAPSVVRPSVVRPSVVVRRRPSVRKLSHFQLLLQNRLMDFDETWKG